MAYVGTPNRRGNDLETLASILQGEAGGEGIRGLQAVADVIRNRANQNFSGYGSGLLDQALARNQFQGQSSKISPEAMTVAQQLQGGNLPDAAGNAVYYANPGASTASWARNLNSDNALKIGNHYFTDNAEGRPFVASPGAQDFVNNNPQPGGFGPGVSDPNSPPVFGSMAPGGGMMAQNNSIDPNVANFAFSDDKKAGPLSKLGAAFTAAMPDVSAPRIASMPSPSGDVANGLMKLMQNPQALAQLLMKQRLG